jgi:hypothetical protein
MGLLTLLLLILIGLLGILDWLRVRQPDIARHVEALEPHEGWIGIAGMVWGLLLFLRWLSLLGIAHVGGIVLVLLLTALVMFALSLVLALPQLRASFGDSPFMARVSALADRVRPYKVGLGFASLVLALYTILNWIF